MASMINEAALARVERVQQPADLSEGSRLQLTCFLDELPGLAVGIVTLTYLISSICTLVW
jgi:hypothetical protein